MHYHGHEPGEKVTDEDLQEWADLKTNPLNAEEAMVVRSRVAEAKAKGKAKARPKIKFKVPVVVKKVRSGGFHHVKALDNILQTMLGKGLVMFCPEESYIGRGLVCDPLKLPPTLILHLDQGSPAFAWSCASDSRSRLAFSISETSSIENGMIFEMLSVIPISGG